MSIASPSVVILMIVFATATHILFRVWRSVLIWTFAETVLDFKAQYGFPILLECAIPCPNQTLKWASTEIDRYNRILGNADKITLVNDHYFSACMLVRNRYMVDHSDTVLAIWNGEESGGTWQTIKYARSQNKKIDIIHIDKI